ncbi:hypothetical protein B5807_04748 [Epicoccum nigrum]|uniref:Mid2 domain-containing protein n=1 Tax=Epicoccum nigrum TaxID=105696 RepID=A0A1Y2M2W0_EPING|nr:hypothetical protein B5807_04748 [Epicoccum nigrum]
MLLSHAVWAAYGIASVPRRSGEGEGFELESLSHLNSGSLQPTPHPGLTVDTASSPLPSPVALPSDEDGEVHLSSDAETAMWASSRTPAAAAPLGIPLSISSSTIGAEATAALATPVPAPQTAHPAVPSPSSSPLPRPSTPLSTPAIAGLCVGVGLAAVLLAYALFHFLVRGRRKRERALRRAEGGQGRLSSEKSVGGLKVGKEVQVGVGKEGEEGEGWGWGRKALSLPRRVW